MGMIDQRDQPRPIDPRNYINQWWYPQTVERAFRMRAGGSTIAGIAFYFGVTPEETAAMLERNRFTQRTSK